MMKKTFISALCALAASLMLSGCLNAPYIEPQNGQTAEMVVRISPARKTLFYLNNYENAETCSGEQGIISDANRISISKFKFAADKLTTLRYVEMQGSVSCSMKFSFFGKANHVYALDSVTTTGNCSVRLWDATDMKTLVPVAIISRDKGQNACPNFKR
ncbi:MULTISPECIES: hypothetical protein [Undibacterium]|uniref:Lipoprotein n=1 Tax=Undibacterium umbellatum TaxID=2762300 RepID=A0ABR6ZFE8_9BURK|nr:MULTISPECIES: hypothetical protein [Undibacterium]MBC3910443.1 hypothetical protein [Undibacterium umbellatum]MDP1980150.1 hypothetical protein [Undibacterium sp.]